MFFFFITKNSNGKILTKNLVTFKIENGVKDENFFLGFTEKSDF